MEDQIKKKKTGDFFWCSEEFLLMFSFIFLASVLQTALNKPCLMSILSLIDLK